MSRNLSVDDGGSSHRIAHMFGSALESVDHGCNRGIPVFVFPDPDHRPAGLGQRCIGNSVSVHVPLQLRRPVPVVRGGHSPVLRADMPEASIDEDSHLPGSKDHVGTDLCGAEVEPEILPVAITHPMELGSQGNFRFGVAPPIRTHIPRSAFTEWRRVSSARVRLLACALRFVFRHGSVDSDGCTYVSDDTVTYSRCSLPTTTRKAVR